MPDSKFKNPDLPAISVARTIPGISQQQLFSYKRCYLGISLENPVFQGRSLRALVSWAAENFEQCLVIIGDYLTRFNERIFNGLERDSAQQAAEDAGRAFMVRTAELFEQFDEQRIRLTRWKPCLDTSEYKKAKAMLDELFTSNSDFRASVEKDAVSFATRQTKRNRTLGVTTEEAIELSGRYLLEEIAVFSALSEQGWKVELYPGPELSVLVDIAKGRFRHIPSGLKDRISVELRISDNRADYV